MKMAVARFSVGSAVPALVVALLACAAARTTVVVGGTACDGVSCGMGTCKEITPVLPLNSTYECHCFAGWAQFLPVVPCLPCLMAKSCLVMDCGPEGMCMEEHDKTVRCRCNSGATNMLNNPSLPCIKNCIIGMDGCPVKKLPPL